ncbi:alpha-1,2-fucosyltransferase [Hymenobacter bucti]|uniref:Alpha-1,2-fucosyltransferase n=1 Tax=Hymenobacter bucti TaxID=1844114 RepID=A0ABW4QST3_9BACT
MVIIRLTGGLGNQMFQYAAGRAAALRHNTKLVLSTVFFEETLSKQAHEQEVHIELFPAVMAQQLSRISGSKLRKLEDNSRGFIRRNYDKVRVSLGLPTSFKTVAETSLLQYQSDFKTHQATVLSLASDWQNEKYFIDYESTIRKDFSFPALPADSPNVPLLVLMQATQSVAVHVRRGDYLTSTTHRPLAVDFYLRAISLVKAKVMNPTFFIFSDDISWCQQQFNLPDAHYITHNTGLNSYRDMQLMSSCQHNIIANSSFSWWGAWLNNNPNKIIIAPEIWLEKYAIKTSNIAPKNWLLL